MKVTDKGQVTIPRNLRRKFRIEAGTEVEFAAQRNELVLRRRAKRDGGFEKWLARAKGAAKPGVTTAAIMKLTRGED